LPLRLDSRGRLSPHRFYRWLIVDAVGVAFGLRDHKQANRPGGWIANLVALAREHANSAPRADQRGLAFNLHQDFSTENVEELLCLLVVMSSLGGARRYEFLDDAQLIMIDEIPGVAVAAPAVVFRVFPADDNWMAYLRRGRTAFGNARIGRSRHQTVPLIQCNLFAMNASVDSHDTNVKRQFFRHTLATLAYRAEKAFRNAPTGFAEFQAGHEVRTPGQIVAHMGDLLDWALSIAVGQQTWHDATPLAWDREVDRFFAALKKFDDFLASGEPVEADLEKLFQGPIADALTHVGQIAMLRRMAEAQVKGENFYRAAIETGRVGREQAQPRKEF